MIESFAVGSDWFCNPTQFHIFERRKFSQKSWGTSGAIGHRVDFWYLSCIQCRQN